MGKLKTRIQFATSIKFELKKQFQNLADLTRIPQSKLMDEAIEDLLKKHNYQIKEDIISEDHQKSQVNNPQVKSQDEGIFDEDDIFPDFSTDSSVKPEEEDNHD